MRLLYLKKKENSSNNSMITKSLNFKKLKNGKKKA